MRRARLPLAHMGIGVLPGRTHSCVAGASHEETSLLQAGAWLRMHFEEVVVVVM
jgi:hypothetical protein